MFRRYFCLVISMLLFSSPGLTFVEDSNSTNSVSSTNLIMQTSQPDPFRRLQNLFFRGDTYFSFSLNDENWYSGRCFLPYANNPSSSLLVLLPSGFYAKPDRGPLFPGHARMWMLGSNTTNPNEFDSLDEAKEKKITQILKVHPIPPAKKTSNALVAKWGRKGTGLALRRFDTYLIVQKFSLYSSVTTEYCYYFNKVK